MRQDFFPPRAKLWATALHKVVHGEGRDTPCSRQALGQHDPLRWGERDVTCPCAELPESKKQLYKWKKSTRTDCGRGLDKVESHQEGRPKESSEHSQGNQNVLSPDWSHDTWSGDCDPSLGSSSSSPRGLREKRLNTFKVLFGKCNTNGSLAPNTEQREHEFHLNRVQTKQNKMSRITSLKSQLFLQKIYSARQGSE